MSQLAKDIHWAHANVKRTFGRPGWVTPGGQICDEKRDAITMALEERRLTRRSSGEERDDQSGECRQ